MKNKALTALALGLGLTAFACTPAATNLNTNATNGNRAANTNANVAVVTNTNTNANTAPTNANANKAAAGHEHTAPHGGTLIVFGEEFAHVELVLDKATGKLTAYALDGEASKGVPLAQPEMEIAITKPSAMTVKLLAVENAVTGEKKGATSQYEATVDGLKNVSNFEASIKSINIKGKAFNNTAFKFPEGNEGDHAGHKGEKAGDHKGEKHADHKDGKK